MNTKLKTITELHDIRKIGELFLLSFCFKSAVWFLQPFLFTIFQMSVTMYQSEQICGACKGNLGLPASWNVKTRIVALYFKRVLATF